MLNETEINEHREAELATARQTWEDIDARFGPGSHGQMEAADRLWIQAENVYGYCLEHPAVLLDAKAHDLVYRAQALLFEAYQYLACQEPPECKT